MCALGRVEGSEVGVELQRVVREPASYRRPQDTSSGREIERVRVVGNQTRGSLVLVSSASRAATDGRVAGWQGSRSAGYGRSRVAIDGAGIGGGTHRPEESCASSCCRGRSLSS